MLAVLSMSCDQSATAPSASRPRTISAEQAIARFQLRLVVRRTSLDVVHRDVGWRNVPGWRAVRSRQFPANSICDPATSTYGPGTWNDPCSTLADGQSVTITATYGFTASGFTIDFSPALRFNPNTKVLIATNVYANAITSHADYYAANPSALHYLGIYYRPQLDGAAQTDAGSDASLVTHVNLNTGIVWRRIKHFSGYNVYTGLPCDPSPDDPDCVDDGGPDVDGGHG